MEILLETQNLSIEYKGINNRSENVKAVNNVSLKIQRGEIYALAGESGCGKSTLAKCITKLVKAKEGCVLFENQNIFVFDSRFCIRK